MPCGRESMAKASADATSPLVAYLTTQGLNVPQLSALIRCATTRSRRDCDELYGGRRRRELASYFEVGSYPVTDESLRLS